MYLENRVKRLEQKVAIITGGGRGIGKQIALTFASEGADIVIGDVIDMEAVAREAKGLGARVITVKTDVSKKVEVKNLIDTAVDNFKKIDILVNDAATTQRASLLEMSEETWDKIMNVNLKGAFFCTQAAARYMIDRKYGKIINMASVAGMRGVVLHPAINYAVSKAGIVKLTELCARELGSYGINVNAIAPGVILTDMTRFGRTTAEFEQFVEQRGKLAALGRLGTAQEIANLALFLASDESSFITGQVIAADGGT